MPVFERPTAVLEALDSVLGQELPPDGLVVVDDGSRDDTGDRVERWIAEDARGFPARLLRQSKRGVSTARNRGVSELPEVELVAFLDSDDLWPPDYLREQARLLSAHPDAVASTSDKLSLDVPSGAERRVARDWVARDTTRQIVRRGPPGVSNTVVRRSAFHEIGGFDERLRTAEDLDLMLRLSRRGSWLYCGATKARYRHRLGESRGEAPALGHQHDDRRRTRADVLDSFFRAVANEDPSLARVVRAAAGRQWSRAGRQLVRAGRSAEALEAFDRAVALRPFDLLARVGRLRAR